MQIFSSDPNGSLVAPRVHSSYFKDIRSTVLHFECSALELRFFVCFTTVSKFTCLQEVRRVRVGQLSREPDTSTFLSAL